MELTQNNLQALNTCFPMLHFQANQLSRSLSMEKSHDSSAKVKKMQYVVYWLNGKSLSITNSSAVI
ncbi:hypothetical protein ACR0IB_17610 [Acinetobacter baumannii]|uniref:hypothetical protein n=1 Tax=Acinetobacter baumannii TaxID=470 RepID=UPI000314F7FD|nr:hypothetical protein [Acinetobacter baumannii]MCA4423964.1 hypothetical protein [Acinetobacter baumannii]QJG75228.1 hypothetical protein HB663_02695 [Acinetobacter baumannii]